MYIGVSIDPCIEIFKSAATPRNNDETTYQRNAVFLVLTPEFFAILCELAHALTLYPNFV